MVSISTKMTLGELLKSANPDYPDMTFPVGSNSIKLYGKVIKTMTLRDV